MSEHAPAEHPEDTVGQEFPADALQVVDGMLLKAYQVMQEPMEIRRASRERDWMEATPERFAYRCLPLVLASQLGWEILCPVDVTASWTGGPARQDLAVRFFGRASEAVGSHFGSGVLTFNPGWLFRTPPGVGLLLTGPANRPKHSISPLEGFVETDATNMTATMNWRFTQPGEVHFRKGEPIARILPYPQFFLDAFKGELHSRQQMPEPMGAEYSAWDKARGTFLKQLGEGDPEARKLGWMRHYMRGEHFASGEKWPSHQTKLLHGEFVDKRGG